MVYYQGTGTCSQGGGVALALVYSRATLGIDAPLVTVEVHLSGGLPNFTIVGLPEAGVRESRERVRSAILNAQLDFPQQRITINLAPADLPKTGGRFDLAIAVGDAHVDARVVMGHIKTTLHDLQTMKEGDLLFFKKPELAQFITNELPAFGVEVGSRGSHVAVRIEKQLAPGHL